MGILGILVVVEVVAAVGVEVGIYVKQSVRMVEELQALRNQSPLVVPIETA